MISPELIKQIRAIQIRTNHLVTDVLAGEYSSAFKGRGMEFEQVREYIAGDDVRAIDWNVTARMGGRPFVKEYREERELTIMLLVDVSSSGQFGSQEKYKNEIAAEIASVLAYAAIKNNDKAGLIVFSDKIEQYIPPKKGRSHIWNVIRAILTCEPEGIKTDLNVPLEFLTKVAHRKTVAFFISDFIASDYKKTLQLAGKKHDVIAVSVYDRREQELPRLGFIQLEDAETTETLLIDTNNPELLQEFKRLNQERRQQLKSLLHSLEIDQIDVDTAHSYIDPLMKFFRFREKRL
ncbi:MAG: DUF58 domain-containing protein [Candidatus Schekmanbacteria bacterium]|nr:DUF58 domain-containing protein [Candidatus Schekmanbacteria bacterium]